jgi:hypothetical protein
MKTSKGDPGAQRLFEHANGGCVLLTKSGEAVSFWVDEHNRSHVIERLEGVDFKATGTHLKEAGWRCVGPGLGFSYLLEKEDP